MKEYNININRSLSLDIIRILAVILVFIPHWAIINLDQHLFFDKIIKILPIIGVELFFCLSGYLICSQAIKIINNKDKINQNLFIYILRRILRTWPTYFLGLICYVIYYRYFDINVFYYFFFLQNMFWPIISDTFFSASWSIVIEEYFYLLYPLIFLFFYKLLNKIPIFLNKNLYIVISCLFIILIISLIRAFIDIDMSNWGKEIRRIGIYRLDAIAAGGFAAVIYFYVNKMKFFTTISLILFIISTFFIFYILHKFMINKSFDNIAIGKNGIFYLFMISASSLIYTLEKSLTINNHKVKIIIASLSDISYPFYIFHILLIDLLKNLFINHIWLNFFTTSIILIIFCYIIRKYIEVPILSKRPKFID
jgi:peptidoglycan/LPS O-acetylase OafA/YrhL